MDNYRRILIFDLSSYGAALAIVNQFCDDEQVKVFELSPIGQRGLLILLAQDLSAAELVFQEVSSFFKTSILRSAFLPEAHSSILPTYLSQRSSTAQDHALVAEFSSVADAFVAAQQVFETGADILDFRVVRTCPPSAILIATATDFQQLFILKQKIFSARSSVLIEKLTPTLLQYFNVV